MSATPIDTVTPAAVRTFANLSDPALWQRIGIGAAGVALIIIGAIIVLRQPIGAGIEHGIKAGTAAATGGASLPATGI